MDPETRALTPSEIVFVHGGRFAGRARPHWVIVFLAGALVSGVFSLAMTRNGAPRWQLVITIAIAVACAAMFGMQLPRLLRRQQPLG